jgi:glycosyltransferase involved in cell wall biosynthesis
MTLAQVDGSGAALRSQKMNSTLAAPRVLLFFLAPRESYRSPLFSPDEIFCGPDTVTKVVDGRLVSLQVPVGSYDARTVLDQLPDAQRPELVIVKADASRRNFPRNLQAFACPKVLIVGDTHHFRSPLRTTIAYALSEPFDFVIFDHTRHHAHWFHQAGVRNLHWIPALDFGFVPRDLRPHPTRPLTFVGQVGRWHPWRRAVLAQVQKAHLPLEVLQGTLEQTADIYADSRITLNISLNGDLNLRTFEALSAGGFLLTDALNEASGLDRLFEAGKHLDVWSTPEELIEKIRHYLGRPGEAAQIRMAGQAQLLSHHHPDIKKRELFDLVFRGRTNPMYDLGFAGPCGGSRGLPPPVSGQNPGVAVYEWVQELHRTSRATVVYSDLSVRAREVIALPRLQFRPIADLKPSGPTAADAFGAPSTEVLWLQDRATLDSVIATFTGFHVIAHHETAAVLSEWGFLATEQGEDGLALYSLVRPVAYLKRAWNAGAHETVLTILPRVLAASESASDCVAVAECAGLLKREELFASALRKAVALDRDCQPALIRLACVAWEKRESASAAVALEEAARCGPLPASVERMRADLRTHHSETLLPYLALTGHAPVARTEAPIRILLVTNLFPPQELGGYGRMMWEFARGLRARGHTVRIVAGHADYLAKAPMGDEKEMEEHVSRSLRLTGRWTNGQIVALGSRADLEAAEAANASLVLQEAFAFEPDLILVGNLDLLGVGLVHSIIYAGYPVLHALANRMPGFTPKDQPLSASYWVAPCSDWNGRVLEEAGFAAGRVSTVHPGARIDRFFRVFLPDTRHLRIAYASLVAPYKGAHVLVDALVRLRAAGCRFTAEIAGDALDQAFVDRLKAHCAQHGLSGCVSFTGFLDRKKLSALFARSNVLVFPSQFEEPFGISQVEAMAAGLVVVTSGTGGAAEIVRDGLDGLVFKAGDPSALAEKLQLLAGNQALFQKLQGASQKRALGFSVNASVRKLETLAAELIEASQALTVEQAAVADVELTCFQSRYASIAPMALRAKGGTRGLLQEAPNRQVEAVLASWSNVS